VLACAYAVGRAPSSRWCESVEDAVRWLEAAAILSPTAQRQVEDALARRWRQVCLRDLPSGVVVYLDDGRIATTTFSETGNRVEFAEVEGADGSRVRPYEYLAGDPVVRVAS
jgi:hypothetical protein